MADATTEKVWTALVEAELIPRRPLKRLVIEFEQGYPIRVHYETAERTEPSEKDRKIREMMEAFKPAPKPDATVEG